MNRRKFLFQASAATTAFLLGRYGIAAPHSDSSHADLVISDIPIAKPIPLTYTGLSYELAQLTEPDFFSASNRDLVAYFRLLSRQGVLRLGGNTSEFCWFRSAPSTQAPELHVPPGNLNKNWMPHRLFPIEPKAIDNLGQFLEATGWRLIYGINFGHNTPARAALEASYVAEKIGKHLEFFQIGNEPDFYTNANNGTRPPGWSFNDYLAEWTGFANAIIAKVPQAKFGGPDVGASSDWIVRFGRGMTPEMGRRLVALTGHYYAEGPPDSPGVTIKRLLSGDPKIPARMKQIEATAEMYSLRYRMTEGNSCYRGGKPGMSNAFASALWAGDYMLLLASLGCAGVNLHGGDSRFLSAGLGDHTPGLQAALKPQTMRSGFYTPIESEKDAVMRAMPVYYGMLLANRFAGTTLVQVSLKSNANVTAYATQLPGGYQAAIFNKDEDTTINLSMRTAGPVREAFAWRLCAPSLDSTEHVMLAGSGIQTHAVWSPKVVEPVSVTGGVARLSIPKASGVLITTRHEQSASSLL